MNEVPETNLTLEQVLPAYFKLVQELEESRKVNQQLAAMFDRSSERAEEFEKKYEDLHDEIEELLYDYENTHCYDEDEMLSKFLNVARKHCQSK